MNKKRILMFVLAVVMCLALICVVACNPETPDTPDNPDNPDKPNPDTPTPVDPDAQSIAIANESDLIKKWNVGEADRTVSVTLSDGLKDKTVTLKAEPEGIVTVDGLKLHAVKKGTVQVTASVTLDETHTYTTDPIEITVAYNYTLAVSNKAALTKAFRIGEADREVTVTVPDALKDLQVKLTSADTTKVSIVNGKLHAVAAAHDGVKITASVQLADGTVFSDSFTVKTWGAFDLNVTNKEALEAVYAKLDTEGRTVEYTLTEAGDYTEADVAITSENANVVRIEDGKILPVGVGETTVKVACGGVTKTLAIKVEAQPVLTLVFDESAARYVGEAFDLPTVTALNSKEEPVTVTPVCTPDGGAYGVSGNQATIDTVGKYTLTYTLHEEGQDDVVKSVTFDVVNKLFGEVVTYNKGAQTSGKLTTTLEGEEGSLVQTVKASSNDIFVGAFNGVNPSQFYYAEATFAIPDVALENDVRVALGHYVSAQKYVLTSTLITYSGNFINIDVDLTKTDNLAQGQAAANNQTCMFVYKALASKHITRLQGDEGVYGGAGSSGYCSTTLVKITVARDGDYFYTFINDQYVQCVTLQALRGKDTVPALVGKYFVNGNTSVTDIEYSADEATVREKLYTADGLLGVNKEKMFVPFIDSNDSPNASDGSSASHSQSYGDNVRIDTSLTSQENGLAFKYENGIDTELNKSNNQAGATVSPYVYFDGNFTFSWEMKLTGIKALRSDPIAKDADNYRSILELKTNAIGYDVVQLGAGPGKNQTTGGSFKMSVKGYTSTSNTDGWRKYCEPSTNDYGVTGLNKLTIEDKQNNQEGTKVRFSLTRILLADHAEYILTATALDSEGNPATDTNSKTLTYTRIVNIGGSETSVTSGNYTTAHSQWMDPMIPYWRNSGVSGEFTNITWSLLPDEISAEFVTDGTGAIALQSKTEKRATNDTGSEFTEITDDMFVNDNVIYNKDIVIDLGENNSLEAGEYAVKIVANGDKKIDFGTTKYNRYDLELSDVYTTIVTVTAEGGSRYLKFNGVTLGHGTYLVTIEKIVVPTPEPSVA